MTRLTYLTAEDIMRWKPCDEYAPARIATLLGVRGRVKITSAVNLSGMSWAGLDTPSRASRCTSYTPAHSNGSSAQGPTRDSTTQRRWEAYDVS